MKNLLVVRGTSWINLWNWRVRVMGDQPWHLLTTSEPIAEYPSSLTEYEAAKRALAEFPDDRIYMRAPDPNAAPEQHENLTVARVMPTVAELQTEELIQLGRKLNNVEAAEQAGREAFARGAKRIPALDRTLNDLLKGSGNGVLPLLNAWLSGWDKANLAPTGGQQ